MAPAILDNIPIYIRNTFEPSHAGTKIFLPPIKGQVLREQSVCGFTTVDGIALLNIEGTGMIGVPGIAHRLFGALKQANISVMFIAQASSEYSICFATKEIHVESAKKSISEAFFYELKQGLISNIRIINKCAIIAAVGESMSNTPGVSGIFFGALGDASVNILSISQGCDERNISAVVYASEATKALRAVHSAFLLSSLDITIGIVGTGRVGSAVILSLIEQVNILNSHFGLNIRIRGIANSKKMLLGENLIPILNEKMEDFFPTKISNNSKESSIYLLKKSRSGSNLSLDDETLSEYQNSDLEVFFQYMKSGTTPHVIIIDATSSNYVASLHPQWLKGLVHVVTANKRAIANSLELYNSVYSSAKEFNRMYMSQVTIGASLPIRTTLYDMLSSGDAVYKIVGLMSVSVGVILNEIIDNGLTFTEALLKTHKTGLFEDDVFVDLEGTEAAQKLLLLARELGVPMSIDDIEIEPIATRRHIESWDKLNGSFQVEDKLMEEKCKQAKQKGCTLRYIQSIECNPPAELGNRSEIKAKASVRLEEVPLDSPYGMVKGAVYYFAFHTSRYSQTPLVIQGPLSDSANTASGIIGDILRIAKSIGAKGKATKSISSPLLLY